MNDERTSRYRKLIRWYPAVWRARNGEAVVATLLDADDAAGRTSPSTADRSALVVGGLYERVIAPERLNRFNLTALIAATVFALWYAAVITWSPGLDFVGTFGPFSNPMVIVSVMLVSAFVLALCGRVKSARLVALFSVASVIVIGVLSATFSWLGPSLLAIAIFAGFGLIAASPLRSKADLVRAGGALFLVAIGFFALAILRLPPLEYVLYDWSSYLKIQVAGAAFVGALILMWPRIRTRRVLPRPE
ncbi:hypothetical protein NYA9BBAC_00123 [Salinibacterium sp. NYA9b]